MISGRSAGGGSPLGSFIHAIEEKLFLPTVKGYSRRFPLPPYGHCVTFSYARGFLSLGEPIILVNDSCDFSSLSLLGCVT